MSKKKLTWIAAVLAALLLAAGCAAPTAAPAATPESVAAETPAPAQPEPTEAPAEEPAEEPKEEPAAAPAEEPEEELGYIEQMYKDMDEFAAQHEPKIVTLESGVQIQRTPDEFRASVLHNPGNDLAYNINRLDADNRGCNACHLDLREVLANMEYEHVALYDPLGTQMKISQCLDCHGYSPYFTENYAMGALMHGIHINNGQNAFTGDCMSCHTATGDGNGLQLWDEVKYSQLRGITDIAEFEGEFVYGQDKTVHIDDLYSLDWLGGDFTVGDQVFTEENLNASYTIIGKEMDEVPLDPAEFENWTIEIKGAVENPMTLTLPELIELCGSETTTMTMHCNINPMGASMIANCNITGVSIKTLMEKVGAKETATFLWADDGNAYNYNAPVSLIEKNGGYLVYEIDGQRLHHRQGYPVQMWVGGVPASNYVKRPLVLEFTEEPEEGAWMLNGRKRADGTYYNKPNVGLLNFWEGQIIKAGEPYTFEGYADAFEQKITAIEISLDRGKNWTSFSTEDTNPGRWINWTFTYTPENTGAFVIMVRGVAENGLISDEPIQFLVNVK